MKNAFIAYVICILCLSGCTNANKEAQVAASPERMIPRQEDGTLAYEHHFIIEVEAKDLNEVVDSVTSACNADVSNVCKVLAASVTTGEYAGATVRLRIAPPGVDTILKLVGSLGTISHRETRVEDLAEPIADNEIRLSTLNGYLEKLRALEVKSEQDVDALIKVESEMSRVQSEVERITGLLEYDNKRIKTEIIELSFSTQELRGFWSPIGGALSDFSTDLSEGVSSTISGTAYVLPWLVIVIPLFILFRYIWRRGK